ncbi:MAG: phosphoribosylformylglycinamidine cyclo-ligase [Pseudomonadota bacterium]|nr:phosphoribosylformylglycinamidine cyclo-ligase [Gammaproteobacteria bacterium]MEC8010779.1 phosphoribosylformylglycinamidine cyclo-ligase [Pseudomonadota bacterium]|tara:strand:- start:1182 stop:2237 length:1056 start_codon:yes stop_codon:yes gene_type:complete
MAEQDSNQGMTYASAGVNIEAGNELVDRIKPMARSTMRPEVLGNLGGFGALCAIPKGYEEPILVSGTDGVGTKLKLAIELNKHDTIGIDLVAMCVNDLLVSGAEPLFFLDYYASGKLEVDQAADIISGIAEGCRQSGCALVGGETAELPGLYAEKDYDLAGFCVGVAEKAKIITGETIKAGDQLIGIASSGIHSNGYSLVRKVLSANNISLTEQKIEHKGQEVSIGEALLEPTKIYAKAVKELQTKVEVKGMAHITGGGITENLPRVLPENASAEIRLDSWEKPALFNFMQKHGNIAEPEMLKTFNMGIGMIVVVSAEQKDAALAALKELGETAYHLGQIIDQQETAVVYK